MDWSDENIALIAREESYFESVIESFGKGTISYGDGQDDDSRPRPLHFLASFMAGVPPGLVLAEASGDNIFEDSDMSDEAKEKWKEATKFAFPGEVFVRGWNVNGQADKLGIFEVGDRLRGVGELPFTNAGLEAALDLVSGYDFTPYINSLTSLNIAFSHVVTADSTSTLVGRYTETPFRSITEDKGASTNRSK